MKAVTLYYPFEVTFKERLGRYEDKINLMTAPGCSQYSEGYATLELALAAVTPKIGLQIIILPVTTWVE